jgi:hypothetical protein
MEILLTYQININNAESREGTALNVASRNGCVDAVKLLIAKGAHLIVSDSKGKRWNALEIAKKCPRVLSILLEHAGKSKEGRRLIRNAGLVTDQPHVTASTPVVLGDIIADVEPIILDASRDVIAESICPRVIEEI